MFSPDVNALTSQLTYDYGVNAYLMAWAHALLNTTIYPLDPKPKWFDSIDSELATTKTRTQVWLVELYPRIAAALPQALIDYANTFDASANLLIPVLAKGNPAGDERAKVAAFVADLLSDAREHAFGVRGLQKNVREFAELVTTASTTMSANVKKVRATITASQTDLIALQSRIVELQNRLGITTTEAKNSMQGAAMTGASLSMTMLAVTVGAMSFPVFGLVGAVIGIGINAAMEAAKSKEVLALLQEVNELRVKLSKEQTQIAALESIAAQFDRLANVATSSLTNMQGVVHHCDDIVNGLVLIGEIVAQPAADLTRLTPFKELTSARAGWKTVRERAQNIQDSVLRTKVETIVVDGAAA
ncbi:MAG: hypothetical protein QOH21_617 [Acidobacteriota bacterium]|jgi:cell division septum initiation protein DivIVA|nr:hypothetical protein [Acidobacteriota bacterium]